MSWQGVLDVGAVLAALAVMVSSWWQRRRTNAQADNYDAQASAAAAKSVNLLLGPLNMRVTDLANKLAAAEEGMAQMRSDHAQERIEWSRQLRTRDETIAKLQNTVNEYNGGIAVLIAQMEENKITPRWKPRTGPFGQGKGV